MKTWKITIKAESEDNAVVYLDILRSGFEAAIRSHLPMDSMVVEGEDKKEIMLCIQMPKKSVFKLLFN